MIKIKKQVDDRGSQIGWSIIIVWLFSVTLTYNIIHGDHITIGFGVGPFEVSFCLSIWRKLLP